MRLFLLLFLFSNTLCIVHTTAGQNTDSLRALLNDDITGEHRASVLQRIGNTFVRKQPDSVYYYHSRAYRIGVRENIPALYARSAQMIGLSFRALSDLDSAEYYNQVAIAIFRSENDSLNLAKILMQQGNLNRARNRTVAAMENFVEASEIFAEYKQSKYQAYALSSLGILMSSVKRNDEAFDYYHRALDLSKKINDPYAMSVILNNLGGLYHNNNQFDEAVSCFRHSLRLKSQAKDSNGMIHLNNNLGAIYIEQQKYDSALYHLEESGKVMKQLGRKTMQVTVLHNYSIIYRHLGKFDMSLYYLDSAESIIRDKGGIENLEKNFKHRYKLDSARGDFEAAFANLRSHIALRDSISGNEMKSKITEIETRYETSIKNREIAELTRKAEINTLRIREQNYQLTGAVILILFIISAGFLWARQRKLKARFQMGVIEQKFLRSQMNPHFIFNALGSIQKYMLAKDAASAGLYLAKFGKLMRQILEHSRYEYIALSDEISTLTNYLDIQKLRFGDRFDYTINLAEDLNPDEVKIPPMFAQPFIENALEHGISEKENGLIEISFRKQGDLAVVEITDNGKGLIPRSEDPSHKSLATVITSERLQLISQNIKKRLHYTIENRKSSTGITGTIVRLTVPCVI